MSLRSGLCHGTLRHSGQMIREVCHDDTDEAALLCHLNQKGGAHLAALTLVRLKKALYVIKTVSGR